MCAMFNKELVKNNIALKEEKFKGEIEMSASKAKRYTLADIRRYRIDIGPSGLRVHNLNIAVTRNGMRYQLMMIFKYMADIHGKVAVINAGDYTVPGGRYTEGEFGEEESICQSSTLYETLSRCMYYYNWNGEHINNGIYTNVCLYTPDIIIHDNSKNCIGIVDVITCSPPDYKRVSTSRANKAVHDRLELIFNVAVRNEIKNLIICGFGCGSAKSDVEFIANTFNEMCALHYSCLNTVTIVVNTDEEQEIFERILRCNL